MPPLYDPDSPSALITRHHPTMEPLKKKAEQGLPHSLAEQFTQLIHAGEFKAGERLNEAALALRMGTSRGPIREAIRILAGQGIVTQVPNRGVYVRQLSVREMLEVYELRAMVFGFAAERASEHIGDAERRQFESLLDAMDGACSERDGGRYYELNLQFHALVLKLAGNQRAEQAYDDYVKELHQFRRSHFNAPGNMRRSNQEHRQLYEAIARGSKARARACAEKHVLQGRQRLLASLGDVRLG